MRSVLFLIILSLPLFLTAQVNSLHGVKTVVLDAGHGGHDPGALGAISKEKDNALAIILKLGAYIQKNYPDVKVIYTRSTDVFVTLQGRADIANKANADLFISVHLNSSTNHDAYGAATYCLGLHKTADNLEVEKRENSVIDLEKDKSGYDVDPNSAEYQIQLELMQNAFINQSVSFADHVQDEFQYNVKRKSNGVKQAGFYVLYRTAMPAVLIETGFISNTEEEKLLASSDGQDIMAKAIFDAFSKYKTEIDKRANGQVQQPDNKVVTNDSSQVKTSTPVSSGKTAVYKVQLYAGTKKETPKKDLYDAFGNVEVEKVNDNLYRYIAGNYHSNDDAQKALTKAKSKGYTDAFIVAFVDGKKTTVSEALKISGN